jgi:hypothetical protein
LTEPIPTKADRRVRDAISGLRLLGGLFVLLGTLPLFGALANQGSTSATLLAGGATVALVGPGVWYFVASHLVRNGVTWAVDRSLLIAAAQTVVIAGLIVVGALTRSPALALPAILGLFFVPALIAMCWQLSRARLGIRDMASTGHGFQPLEVRPVLLIEPGKEDAAEAPAEKI